MLVLALLLALPVRASDWSDALAVVRARPADLDLHPELYDGPLKTEAVERLMKDPVSIEAVSAGWRKRLEASTGAGLVGFCADLLAAPSKAASKPLVCPGWPDSLNRALAPALGALAAAQRQAAGAAASLKNADRDAALALVKGPILNEDFARPPGGAYARLKEFDPGALIGPARELALKLERALPKLARVPTPELKKAWRCPLPGGEAVVLAAGDGDVPEGGVAGASLVVNVFGRKRYLAPVAAAGPGQVRVLVDLGAAAFAPQAAPTLGSGVFGVGLAFLPNLGPATAVEAGDLSLGAGLFGVGAAFLRGDGLALSSSRFGQGAGAFGAGILSISGVSPRLFARYSSQGFGFTRGAGLLRARGAGAALRCGLYYADPHEPVAFSSFCQGAGLGPRAFAGGGLGLAEIEGSSATLESGYFSQGAGYWHGAGALFVRGDGARLKARRYTQGAGIHSAAGALVLEGSRERTASWGVGPGFGWDVGLGFFSASGDDDLFQADWATGRAEINSDALVRLRGRRNRLSLPGLGAGTFRRAGPSWSVALIEGADNRLWIPGLSSATLSGPLRLVSPWGVVSARGALSLEPKPFAEPVDWPAADQGAEFQREHAALAPLWADASVENRLFEAASAGFDGRTFELGARGLLGLSAEDAPRLIHAADPDRFDELLWLRLAAAGLGEPAAKAALAALPGASGRRKALLLDLARLGPARIGAPAALAALEDPEPRQRRAAASALAGLLGSQPGDEPGRLLQLRASLEWLESGRGSTSALVAAMGQSRLPDLSSYLALGRALSADERLALLKTAGNPFDTVNDETVAAYGALLLQDAAGRAAALSAELSEAGAFAARARSGLERLAGSPDPLLRAAAFSALGAIGPGQSGAAALARALDDEDGAAREAAAAALARSGQPGVAPLSRALASRLWRARAAAVAGLAQSPQDEAPRLVQDAFRDKDERVRLTAISAHAAFQSVVSARKKDLLPALSRLAGDDPSPSARASAAAAAAAIAPAP